MERKRTMIVGGSVAGRSGSDHGAQVRRPDRGPELGAHGANREVEPFDPPSAATVHDGAHWDAGNERVRS